MQPRASTTSAARWRGISGATDATRPVLHTDVVATGKARSRAHQFSACDQEVEGCSPVRGRAFIERRGAQWEKMGDVVASPARARSPGVNTAADTSASTPIAAPRTQMPAQCQWP